jgi:AcrR family transcriptional regulator
VARTVDVALHDPPPAGTKGRRTHDALLDATERRLAAGGYPAATSTAIAADAGLSTGTFYTYFEDRHAALAAAFARRLENLIAAVEAELRVEGLLDDGLEAVLEHAVVSVWPRTWRRTFTPSRTPIPSHSPCDISPKDDSQRGAGSRSCQASRTIGRCPR